MNSKNLYALVLIILLLAFAVKPCSSSIIEVSLPSAATSNSEYDRNPSIVYDGTNYWLFYTKGDNTSTSGVRGLSYDPDADTYVVYYKMAGTIAGLAGASETKLELSESARPSNFSQRVVSATHFSGKIYAFVSSGQDGTDRGLHYYEYDYSSWSGPTELIANSTARGGHVNVTSDGSRVYIVWESSDGSSDCYTWDGTNLSSKIDISAGNQPKITLFTGTKAVAVLYVVNIEDGTGDIEVFQAATDTLPGFGPHSTAISGAGLYDPCIFNDGSNLYVISSPYISGQDRQYLVQAKSIGTSVNWAVAKTVSYGGHGSTAWWDYWPCAYHDGSNAYVFFTTEVENGPFYSDGEIGYIKMDWDLSHDHVFYIQNGVDQAGSPDTVSVAAGTYVENVVIAKSLDLIGAGSTTTIIDGNNIGNTVTITASNVTVSGFKVTGGWANGLDVFHPVGGVVVDGNSGDTSLTGITIEDNIIDGNAGNGVYVSAAGHGGGTSNVVIKDCQISNNGGSNAGISLTYPNYIVRPVGVWDEWKRPKNILVEGNIIFSNSEYGVYLSAGQGNVIRSNIMRNNSKYGLQLASSWNRTDIPCEYTTVDSNQIYDNVRNGVKLTSYNQYNTLTGNDIYNNGFGGTSDYYKYGFLFQDGNDNTIENNTITGNALGGLYLWGKGDPSYTWYSTTNNTITGNIISGHIAAGAKGIYIPSQFGNPNSGFLNSSINGNSITNNSTYGLENADVTQVVDASSNWWGTNTPAGVSAEVSAYIDYTPWLHSSTDTDPVTPGFQGDFSVLDVDDDSPQTGSAGRIQEGIDLVTGSTVNVAAGTYGESIVFATDFDKDGLIISGDVSDRPVITAGVRFLQTATIDGITFENLYIKGLASGANMIFDMDNSGTVNDFAMHNCVFDGENVSGRPCFGGQNLSQSFSITNTEFKDILGWALMDMESGSGDGGSNLPFTTITFAENDVHDCNGSVSLRGSASDRTDQVDVYGNTFSNIGGNQSELGEHWAAFEVNHADVANIYNNDVDDVAEGQWGEGQATQLWDVGTVEMHDNSFTNCHQGIFIFGGSEGGTYGGPYAIPGGSIHDNTIAGNSQYGLSIDATATGGPLDAECNWWGSMSGPYNATSNAMGQGNSVSDNVDFEAWSNADLSLCEFTTTPDTVWVDDDYDSTDAGGHYWQHDAFDKVQDGVGRVAAGGVVIVAAGPYNEQVIIDKDDLTLTGPQAGVDPGCSGFRGDEATITYAGTDPTFCIVADNAVVDGFTIEHTGVMEWEQNKVGVLIGGLSQNPLDHDHSSDGNSIQYNIITGGHYNMYIMQSSDNTIQHNRLTASVKEQMYIIYRGIGEASPTRFCRNNQVLNNCFDKAGVTTLGRAICLSGFGTPYNTTDFTGTLIQANIITDSGSGGGQNTGISVNYADGTESNPITIKGNSIDETSDTWYNGFYARYASHVVVDSNSFAGDDHGVIYVQSNVTNLNFTNNVITSDGVTYGYIARLYNMENLIMTGVNPFCWTS